MQTTVVGSYPKIGPGSAAPSLRTAITRNQLGRVSDEELARVEDEVTKEVLHDQARAGLDLVTDGHIRWNDPQTYFASGIEGFTIDGLIRYFDSNTYYRQPVAESRLRWSGPISVEHYLFAAANSDRPVKAVVIGPYTLAKLSRWPHFPDLREVVLALAEVLNQEARALSEAGADVVQFDEPAILQNKGDIELFQEAMTLLVDGVAAQTALFAYFGDVSGVASEFVSLPFRTIGLDFVMGSANYDLLEGFPEDKELGLGIVDARNTKMETVDEIVDRIERAASFVALDRIQVSPSCGLEFLPRRNAYAKLERMVEGATKAREVLS